MVSKKKCVHHLFEEQVERTPEQTAIIFEDQHLTYAELNQRANQLARRLQAADVGTNVLVGISMERSVEMVIAIFAVLKAGGAYVPLDPDYPKARLDYMIEDSQVKLILTQQRLKELFGDTPCELIVLDEEAYVFKSEDRNNPSIVINENDLSYAFYTSGSTGKPKGVMIEHQSILQRVEWLQQMFNMDSTDRLLQKSPYSFDVSIWEFFWPLMCGATLVVAKPQGHLDNTYLLNMVKEKRITMIQFVPTMLQTFLSEEGVEDVPHLKHVFLCGEPLSAALHKRYCKKMSAQLHNLYGPTEAAVFITAWTSDRDESRTIIPIGKAIEDNGMYVLNEQYEPLPPWETGELFISGIGLARGYINRPELTAERFVPDPFSNEPGARMYHTGDLGYVLDDGNFVCLGRNDDQVKLRGFRIELGEINSLLEEHKGVHQAVSMIREDQPGDERLAAYYIPDEDHAVSVSELRSFLQDRLPEYMIPSYFVEMIEFPLTPSGKTDRKELPSPTLSRMMISQQYIAPETYIEKEIAMIWAEFFDLDQIGIDDDFIDLGGHSLVAAQILVRIERTFEVKVSLKDMLTQGKNIRSLSAIVEELLLSDTDDDEMEQLLREMENMSEEEIAALIK